MRVRCWRIESRRRVVRGANNNALLPPLPPLVQSPVRFFRLLLLFLFFSLSFSNEYFAGKAIREVIDQLVSQTTVLVLFFPAYCYNYLAERRRMRRVAVAPLLGIVKRLFFFTAVKMSTSVFRSSCCGGLPDGEWRVCERHICRYIAFIQFW